MNYEARVVRLFEQANFVYRGHGQMVPPIFDKRVRHVMAELTVAGQPPETKRLLDAA